LRAQYVLGFVLLLVVAILIFALSSPKQETCKPVQTQPGGPSTTPVVQVSKGGAAAISVPPLADVKDRVAQGVAVTFDSNNASDHVTSRTFALYVPDGIPPTPFLNAGPFKAKFESDLSISIRDEFVFSADGRGALKFEVNGESVLEASGDDFSTAKGKTIKLKKGVNHIAATYQSPAKGDALFRMYWTGSEFNREPLPIVQLHHNIEAKPLREGRRVREGRELFAELRCSKCHDASSLITADQAKNPLLMPELSLDAPSLAEAGDRLKTAWIAQWVKGPRALRPESTMPSLLHGDSVEKDSVDIAGFIASCSGGAKDSPVEKPSAETISAGGGIFATLGCIGCHTRPDKEPVADRIPLNHVREKWKASALPAFLHQPDKHYASIRMPNFRLSDDEANKLAAFVLYSDAGTLKPEITELKGTPDAAHGKQLVEAKGCLNCHTVQKEQMTQLQAAALKDIPAAGWAQGCMGADTGKAPNFSLTDNQRQALLAFAATDRTSLLRDVPQEFVERRITVLRCAACHHRDETDDHWSNNAPEVADIMPPPPKELVQEGVTGGQPEVDQSRPALTWTGEKLKPEWMAKFIKGEITYKPRPWILARMPGFVQQHAEELARGLAAQHGYSPVMPTEPEPNAELAEMGKRLVGKREGLACTACHSVGNTAAVGVFEAPGINFQYVRERLRKNYFVRWITDPLRVDGGSKMPKFSPDGKTTLITEILGGDAAKQFEAVWQFLLQGENIVAPEE